MRGKRLTVDEVKALPLGTKVVVFRDSVRRWPTEYQGESIETIEDDGMEGFMLIDEKGVSDLLWENMGEYIQYYVYIEGSDTNEETI